MEVSPPEPAVTGEKCMPPSARRALAGVAALAMLIKILLALKTYGTNDVYVYDQFSVWTRYLGVLLYRMDPTFNHPPSMIYVLHLLSWMTVRDGDSDVLVLDSSAEHPGRRRESVAGLENGGREIRFPLYLLVAYFSGMRAHADLDLGIPREHRFSGDVFHPAHDLYG